MRTELDNLILRCTGGDEEQTMCSLDELVDTPAEFGDPVALLIRKEEERGVPIVFQRDIDEEIRLDRRLYLS